MSTLDDTPGDPSSPLRGEGSGDSDPPSPARHPAKYPDTVLHIFQEFVNEHHWRLGDVPLVLDPFAGVGRIHELHGAATFGIELESEWAEQSRGQTYVGDCLEMMAHPSMHEMFDYVMTSPTYGNRMADTYDGRDGSKRHTYRIDLGRMPSEGSSAVMQWGDEYRDFHQRAWETAWDVLKPEGLLLINMKDHIRDGERQPVTSWHRNVCRAIGYTYVETIKVPVSGLRHGANHEARIDHESIIVLEKQT